MALPRATPQGRRHLEGNQRGGKVGPYYANAGPARGPLRYGDVPGAVGAREPRDKPMPTGMALRVGRDDAGRALWELVVDDVLVPGRWVVIDREFRPAQ